MNVVERKRERAAKSRRKGDTEACSRHELRGKDFSMYFSASRVPLGLATNFTLACPYTILAHCGELDWEAGFSVEAGLVRVSLGMEDKGMEDKEDLLARFQAALRAAEMLVLHFATDFRYPFGFFNRDSITPWSYVVVNYTSVPIYRLLW